MNILFTICGRAGSKGVKNKNIKKLLGMPLVYYTIASIALYKKNYEEKDVLQVVVNTDSEELIDIVKAQKHIPVYIIHRSEILGGDDVPKVAVIKECLEKCEAHFGSSYDMVVDLDITSPLRTVEDINNAITMKQQRPDTDVVYSVTGARRNPYFNMVKEENDYTTPVIASKFTARQQAPAIYDMNASIYAYDPESLKHKSAVGFFNNKCFAIQMKDTAVLDIDSEEDFELMEIIAKYLFEKYPEFGEIRYECEKM